jgi:poly-gamma-glutamate synthesis protein (capsule biosynthesis protein)
MKTKEKSKNNLKTLIFALICLILIASSVLVQILLQKNQPEKTEENQVSLSDNQATESKKTITLSFVGDVSLADNWYIAPKYDERGGISGVLDDKILKIMRESDYMIANSEFTVSNRGEALKGKTYTFRAKPERLKIYDEMGVDLVSLANNHVYDYGETAFLDMLDAFEEYKIPHVGAGRNLEEAEKAYITEIGGYKFAFVAATRAEKNIFTAGATKNSPGVFRCYDPSEMIHVIKELRKDESIDFIIPQIHFGRENSHQLEKEQVESAKAYIDAGADVIVGHHAHTLQGIEFYKEKPIIYNLGNFLFNDETIDTALFQFIVTKEGNLEYYIIPALQKNEKTSLAEDDKKQQIINDLNSWSINASIGKDGKIEKK